MSEDRSQKSEKPRRRDDTAVLDALSLLGAVALVREFLEDTLQTGRNSFGPSPDYRKYWNQEDPEWLDLAERAEAFLEGMGVDWMLPVDITEER